MVIYSLFDSVFCVKIRQCDYCLDSFVCGFMVAPYVEYEKRIERECVLGEKSLSVKVLINKEDFEIVDRFLARWGFNFWVVK